jgi:hypothetical protein
VVRFTHGRVEWILPLAEAPQPPEVAYPDWSLVLPAWAPGEAGNPANRSEPAEGLPAAAPPAPAAVEPQAGAGRDAAASPEESLLRSLRRDQGELARHLEEVSGHWGYEDPIYRFYHQSFKVYGLQGSTESIVQRLRSLAPDLRLAPWFEEIVQAGTGKRFKTEDNARWAEATRPILEAFFHARFFLEMAVRYAGLSTPPQPLPSGYAALLCLLGLR